MKKHKNTFLILDSLRSSQNVGSIFRTADATGVEKIFLCGYTPAPIDRFGRENTKLTKASLGAEKSVLWEKKSDVFEVVQELKDKKVQVVAVEQDKKSGSYDSFQGGTSIALVFGNEVDGVSREVLEVCDQIIDIPMHGEKESLNVAVSVGVVLYGLRKNLET